MRQSSDPRSLPCAKGGVRAQRRRRDCFLQLSGKRSFNPSVSFADGHPLRRPDGRQLSLGKSQGVFNQLCCAKLASPPGRGVRAQRGRRGGSSSQSASPTDTLSDGLTAASSPRGRARAFSISFAAQNLPLPLGEVSEHSEDGEGAVPLSQLRRLRFKVPTQNEVFSGPLVGRFHAALFSSSRCAAGTAPADRCRIWRSAR